MLEFIVSHKEKRDRMIEHLWNAPVSEAKMARCIETQELHPGQWVLDVGCGCGEVLIRLHERYQIQGTGIDTSTEYIAEARKRPWTAFPTHPFALSKSTSGGTQIERLVDLAICMGARRRRSTKSDHWQSPASRPASNYAGTYESRSYEKIAVVEQEGKVHLKLGTASKTSCEPGTVIPFARSSRILILMTC
jgi:SAM-dependent methyltransferase